MTTHVIYAYSETEASDISGDPYPQHLIIPPDSAGRLPFLVEDGADITVEIEETDSLVRLAEWIFGLGLAFAAGYLIGLLYLGSYGA